MVRSAKNEVIIFDLEYTTWKGALQRNWSKKNEIREITWIAAIAVNADTLKETDAFECIIKPVTNPVLSEYFTGLTGLTQHRMDREGKSFLEGIHAFRKFVDSRPAVSHGWDAIVLLENFKLKNLKFRAKRLVDDTPITLNSEKDNRQQEAPNQAEKSLEINIYGANGDLADIGLNHIVYEVDLDHPGRFISPSLFTSFNIQPWINAKAPETTGKYAGELATVLGQSLADGNIHEPLFDVRSILRGVTHLIKNCGAENYFKHLYTAS